jgi:hypothetical protein
MFSTQFPMAHIGIFPKDRSQLFPFSEVHCLYSLEMCQRVSLNKYQVFLLTSF